MSHLFKECFKASFFIVKDNNSFAEIITSSMTMKALKKRCKELKAKLQAREIILSSSIYSERSRFQRILDSSLFTDEKNSIWKNWYEKVQNKLKINVDLFSSERVKLSYIHFRLFDDAAEITQSRRERDCFNSYKIVDELLKELAQLFDDSCYDSSYASMLIAMLMTMLMTIVDRSSLDYRVVSRSTLFRVSLCSSESYR